MKIFTNKLLKNRITNHNKENQLAIQKIFIIHLNKKQII